MRTTGTDTITYDQYGNGGSVATAVVAITVTKPLTTRRSRQTTARRRAGEDVPVTIASRSTTATSMVTR
jgi:hypothetical protein